MYKNNNIYLETDSTGVFVFHDSIPLMLNLYEIGCFNIIHIIDTNPNSSFVTNIKNQYQGGIISVAPPNYNVIEMFLQSEFEYEDSVLYWLNNDRLFPLDFGLKKVK